MSDNMKVNEYMPSEALPVKYEHMVYFGDGFTDVPSMTLIRNYGGHSAAVYADESCKEKAQKLIEQQRVDFIAKADYTLNGEIYNVVTSILKKIKADLDFNSLLHSHNPHTK